MRSLLRASLLSALLAGAAACDDDPTGAGPPAQVTVAAGGDQTAPVGQILANPILVRVTDSDGDPVQGVEVRFAVTSGGGIVAPGVDSTDAQGQATTAWRLGTASADSQRVQVQVINRNGSVAATTVVRATAQALAGHLLLRVSTPTQTGAVGATLADSLAVRLVDELGNGVPGATITWTVSPMAGTVSPVPSVTRADGTAKVAWTLGQAIGAQEVVASVAGLASQQSFGATVTSPFSITIHEPLPGRMYGDSLPVRVTAQATSGTIVRVTARLEGRAVNLSGGQGALDLAGLAEGPKTLQVWAVGSAGDSALATLPFTYNRAPQLTVTGPARGAVIRTGAARIDADCADASGCTRVAVYATEFPDFTPGQLTLLAEGTTSFHADVALGALNGRRITLVVQATDALGGTSRAVIWPLYVENTPTWTEVASAGLRALDVDATRILYVDSAAGTERVMVRALAGGTPTELLQAAAGDEVQLGRLFAGGAIFSTRDRVYESRGGPAAQLAVTTALGYALSVEGSWAAYSAGGTLWRRNLSAGTTTVVSTDVLTGNQDVAANGDVAFTGSNHFGYRWRDGVATPVSAGLIAVAPRTDGTQVISHGETSIYLWRGGAPLLLSTVAITPNPPGFYEVNGGWAAFVKADPGGVGHVFTMAPDGTVRQASSGGESGIAAVGPDGTVAFVRISGGSSAFRRWVSEPPYTAAPVDVGGALGDMRFIGGDLYVFVGRSAFRVTY